MDSKEVIEAVLERRLTVVEDNPHYRIHDCTVKEYPPWRLLVQSSREPIPLGAAMTPFLDTGELHEFAGAQGIAPRANTPQEVYNYNWVNDDQGEMIFDVGFVVGDGLEMPLAERFEFKDYPALKVASIVYFGPFPHEPMSGWGNIDWDRRAREKELVYRETLYRELYHAYDFESHWHITEIQILIE